MTAPPSEPPDPGSKSDALRDLPVMEDDPRFSPEQMIACTACSRSNPPNRALCLYCGRPLESDAIDTSIAKINYQQPEPWEDGYSLVYAGKGELAAETTLSAAELLHVDQEVLENLLAVGAPVPLICLRSLPDAGLLASRLSESGFDCAIVGDDLLLPRISPTRIRSVQFSDDEILLEDFNTGEFGKLDLSERVLLVVGALVKTSTEVSGKPGRKAMKKVHEALTFADELVVDIYPRSDVYGFRIRSAGFDFSCLGDRMQPLAAGNVNELVSLLRSRIPSVVFVDAFRAAVPLISSVWPIDEIKQSSQVSRSVFSGVRKKSLTILDNSSQFTKFSRLQRHFI